MSTVAGSYSKSIFSFKRKCQTISFHIDLNNPISAQLCQHLVLSLFLILIIVVGVE